LKAATAFCLSLFLFILGAAPAGADPSLVYLTRQGGTDVAVDSAGNAIVLGGFSLAKISPLGELIFRRELEMFSRTPYAVAVDPAGYIYLTGTENYSGECCVGSEANLGFVVKLSPDGTETLYDTAFSEGEDTQAHDIAVDALGRAHVHFTSDGDENYFSWGVSFSPAGSVQGSFGYAAYVYSYVTAMAMGPSGDLFTVGWQYPDSYSYATYLHRTDASSGAMFETLLDDSGTIELVDVAGGPGGSSAVVGVIWSSTYVHSGYYIAGFGPEGEEVFSRTLDLGTGRIHDVAVTPSGEIVLVGDTRSNSRLDAVVLRLDGGTGEVLSSTIIGAGYGSADSVAIGPRGDVYVAGISFVARFTENRPPDCSRSTASPSTIWPPDRRQVRISTLGVTDPDGDPVTLKVTRILQDELFNARMPDAGSLGTAKPWVRADRMDNGDGRVYHLFFEATDPASASCTGKVKVCVPLQSGGTCRDGGARIDSTTPR
jgi:hypothetical protein